MEALFEPSADALQVEFGKRIGVIPEKAGPDAIEKYRARLADLRRQRAEKRRVEQALSVGPFIVSTQSGKLLDLEIEKYERLQQAESVLEAGATGGGAPVHIHQHYQPGTVINAGDKRRSPFYDSTFSPSGSAAHIKNRH